MKSLFCKDGVKSFMAAVRGAIGEELPAGLRAYKNYSGVIAGPGEGNFNCALHKTSRQIHSERGFPEAEGRTGDERGLPA